MKKLSIIASLALILIFPACSSQKPDLAYFQDLTTTQGEISTVAHTATIEPESHLVIVVNSDEPEATVEFNQPYINPVTPGVTSSNLTPTMMEYVVDNKGNIDFPKLGTIHVAGMTTYELKEYLIKRISEYVKNPVVSVTLQGYRIVVMGEVRSPRTIETSADRFSILDALAAAGDLTEYAVRDNIILMRRTADNRIEYHRINLHDSSVVSSPYFWLQNNDVVLVSPNHIKEANSKYNTNNAYKLSVISTCVGMATAVISLVIALCIK